MCQAVTESNVILNQTIRAAIFEGVQIITESMLSYRARLCEPVVLNCTALHQESIIWSKLTLNQSPKVVTNSIDERVTVLSETGQLVIREAKLSDNGMYFCAASNLVSSEEITAYLTIIDDGKMILSDEHVCMHMHHFYI